MIRVAFDIDDTLWKIDAKHLRQVPDYDLISVLKWFYNNNDRVYVWSAGGMDYAQGIVDKLGLTDMVTVIPKNGPWLKDLKGGAAKTEPMDIAFDDCETNLATVDVRVHRPRIEIKPVEEVIADTQNNEEEIPD